MSGFRGFPAEAMTFFRQLKKNNRREWFQQRKPVYDDKVKAPMAALVQALNSGLATVAPDYVTDPAKAIYRIYRDTRFSKDKTPYKTHIGALFMHRALGKHTSAALYVGVSPEELEVAGGVYMPGPEQILIIRTLLADHHEEFRRLTGGRAFRSLLGELQGAQLSRVPKGFPADHPAADLLRRKQWYFYVTLDPGLATTTRLLPEVNKRFLAMVPMLELLNAPLLRQKKKAAARAMF